MLTFLLKVVVFFRRILEPVSWFLFHKRGWEKLEDLDNWDEVKDLSPKEFSQRINKLKYKSDPIGGLIDYSFPIDKPQYFFKNLDSGRDCDDWARLWVCYYKYHNLPCEEWVLTNKWHPFTNSHFVAVVHEEEGYRLLNYRYSEEVHPTAEEAIAEIAKEWQCYQDKDRIQCRYKKY